MSENELKAVVDAVNRRVEVVVPDGFAVMVNGIRMVPVVGNDSAITPDEFPLGSEQNPAKDLDKLPDGTGLVVNRHWTKKWFLNGEPHREDGPAVEYSDGYKAWYRNGLPHREDATVICCEVC